MVVRVSRLTDVLAAGVVDVAGEDACHGLGNAKLGCVDAVAVAAAQAPADECRTVGCVQACCLADLASGDVGDLGGALGRPVLETVLDGVEGSPALDLGAVGHLDLEGALQGRGDLAILVVAVLVGAPGHRAGR